MTKQSHDAHRADSQRDAVAMYRAVIRNDGAGISAILHATPCRRCLTTCLVEAGLFLAADAEDLRPCDCGNAEHGGWVHTDAFYERIEIQLGAMTRGVMNDEPLL